MVEDRERTPAEELAAHPRVHAIEARKFLLETTVLCRAYGALEFSLFPTHGYAAKNAAPPWANFWSRRWRSVHGQYFALSLHFSVSTLKGSSSGMCALPCENPSAIGATPG